MDSQNTKPQENAENAPMTAEQRQELKNQFMARMEEAKARMKEANEVIGQGKGRLRLEKTIKSGDQEITELVYDFTEMTGVEYTDAMDSDQNAVGNYRITYRQALALFAKAAAKQTEGVDMQDILANIGVTDAVEGVQLATLFFNASTRAGRLRISKK